MPKPRKCPQCKKMYTSHNRTTFCSSKCWGKSRRMGPMICERCGKKFKYQTYRKYCTQKCSSLAAVIILDDRSCRFCDKIFTPKGRLVRCLVKRICCLTHSGSALPLPIIPSPPALETAEASSNVAT